MLDSIILTTRHAELAAMFEEHKAHSRRHERRLNERLKALGGLTLTSMGKDLGAIAAAQATSVPDSDPLPSVTASVTSTSSPYRADEPSRYVPMAGTGSPGPRPGITQPGGFRPGSQHRSW